MKEYDYVIVGSGIAGLYTALLARQHGSVLILTKSSIEECNTKYAQGGIAAAIGRNDSPELHLRDTLAAGAGLSDPEVARILTEEAPDRINDLINFGVPFDTVDGEIALTREAAHSVPRILHAGGDATGEKIEISLSRVARLSRITILEYCLATDILVEGGVAVGVKTLDAHTGLYEEFRGRFIILATGGGGRLYKFNTNPDIATGDGIALAYGAGAEVTDLSSSSSTPPPSASPECPSSSSPRQ
jgi:L-aspartate oxidase